MTTIASQATPAGGTAPPQLSPLIPAPAEDPEIAGGPAPAESPSKEASAHDDGGKSLDQAVDADDADPGTIHSPLETDPVLGPLRDRSRRTNHFGRYTNAGMSNVGDHATFNISTPGPTTADPSVLDVSRLNERLATFVPPPGFADVVRLLETCRVVELVGAQRTGRYTAAAVALARRHGDDRIREIALPSGCDPRRIAECDDLLKPHHGYVIRLGDQRVDGLNRQLRQVFERRGASAVIVRASAGPRSTEHHAEIWYAPPDRLRIFERHLTEALADVCVSECGDACDGCGLRYAADICTRPIVRDCIAALAGPHNAVRCAQDIARNRPDGDDELAAWLPSVNLARRKCARTILLTTGKDHLSRYDQYRRSLRLAYAAFNGQSYARVSEAAGLLQAALDTQLGQTWAARPALAHDLKGLLGEEISAGEAETSQPPATIDRCARMEDHLMLSVIDVAWNDFDNTQPALIDWISRLADEDEPGYDQAAMRMAVVCAAHDFRRLRNQVIGPWARNRRRRYRHIAAGTMGLAAVLPDLMPSLDRAGRDAARLARDMVFSLAMSKNAFERDTAALAWTVGLIPHRPEAVVAGLTHLARCGNMRWHVQTVTDAVERTADEWGAAWTLRLLKQWADADDPRLGHQATRCFLELASRGVGDGQCIELLDVLSNIPDLADVVAGLWHQTLVDPSAAGATSVRAWHTAGAWLRACDDPRYRRVLGVICRRLAADRRTYRRLDHWLSRSTAPRPSTSHFSEVR